MPLVLSALLLPILLLNSNTVLACRCAPLTLAEYFDDAEQVLMGELQSVAEEKGKNRLQFRVLTTFYKGGSGLPGAQQAIFSTAASSASCGVTPELGAIYVIFGQAPELSTDDYTIDTCSGTRIHLARSMPEPQGFEDVPAKFVAQQLNGLTGLEIMKAFSANYPVTSSPTNKHVLGLLDIKDFSHGGPVRLYAKPDVQTQPMLSIESYQLLETREVGYEQPAAVVYTVIPGWYRLHLLDGQDAWLTAEQAGTWFTEFGTGTALGGWIPAYGVNGEPNAWFYSRGC